jgi:uncharacterized membrane protein YeiH
MLYVFDLLGVAVFAATGALAAGRKSMDLLGVVVIAAVTAVGGGTIRDLLLDRHPVFWMTDPAYLAAIVAAASLTLVYVRYRRPPANALAVADAFGLGLFTISGAQIAERVGVPGAIVVVMATITGVAGGVLRDVLSSEIPLILRRGNIYATASIAGSATYLLLEELDLREPLAALLGMAVVVSLRLAALLWGLQLPVFSLPNEPRDQ